MTNVQGTDLSNNNSGSDWDGIEFSFFKATEGTGFVDKTFSKWQKEADDHKVVWAGYHFCHPDQHSPEQEADYFLAHCPKGKMPPALDCETRANVNPMSIMGPKALADWSNTFCSRVHDAWGQVPFWYSFRDYTRNMLPFLDHWPLWLASAAGQPTFKMYGGRTVAIEQWGIVGGIDRNEGYDLQLEGGSAEVATEPGRAMSMVTPTFYLKRNPDGSIKEPAEKDTSKPHPYKGAIFLLDGNTATHVASPHMVNVNNFLGVAGPSDLDGDWFDEYAVLPTVSFKPTL